MAARPSRGEGGRGCHDAAAVGSEEGAEARLAEGRADSRNVGRRPKGGQEEWGARGARRGTSVGAWWWLVDRGWCARRLCAERAAEVLRCEGALVSAWPMALCSGFGEFGGVRADLARVAQEVRVDGEAATAGWTPSTSGGFGGSGLR